MTTSPFGAVMASAKNARRVAKTRVCFSPDINIKYAELDLALNEALEAEEMAKKDRGDKPNTTRRLAPTESASTAIAEQMKTLIDENPEAVYDVKLQALPDDEWMQLRSQHPPRDGNTDDQGVFNSDTFGKPAVFACLLDPEPTDEVRAFLADRLTHGEWERLTLMAWGLNEGTREVPKLDRALSILNGNAKG